MNLKKEEFLKEFGNIYGYPNSPQNIDQIRDSEFNNRLQGVVYLDHAGATLYSESQLEAVFKDLSTNVYGNPHSQSNSSSNIDNIVDKTRQQVLDYCNASPKDYKCIFTSGATAAFKLIGESFPWSSESNFMYTMENHNSVLGIREYPRTVNLQHPIIDFFISKLSVDAKGYRNLKTKVTGIENPISISNRVTSKQRYALSQGAAAFAIDIDEAENNGGEMGDSAYFKVTRHPTQRRKEARCLEEETIGNTYNLFAFPSECNFSGVRFSLDLVKTVKENVGSILEGPPACNGRWIVLVDAAKGCSTEPPDLSKYHADFVVISFYKLFGYPTGLGALLVHNEAAKLLKKTYFSGGTVAASIADIDFVKKRDGFEESFEDGTISFLSIASIRHGFKILNTLSCSAISSHTKLLSAYTRKILSSLRHDNGADVCTLYGKNKSKVPFDGLGSVVSFNLKRCDGSWFGYGEVEKLASLSAIKLRTGCFCNPGACAKYLGLSHLDLLSNIEAGHVCWDDYDIVHGKPTGAVRISFGYMSTFEDVKKFIEFVVTHFVSLPHKSGHADLSRERHIPIPTEGRTFFLKSIFIYPIKSCAGFSIDSWPLSNTGLLYDREWLLKSPSGEILTQKKVPEMRLICTYIDLKTETMFVESPRCKTKLLVNLSLDAHNGGSEEINLLAHRYRVQGYTENINIWFSTAIGRPCSLLRCSYSDYFYFTGNCENEGMCRDAEGRLNFVNEAQLLLVSEESIQDLNNKLRSRSSRGSAVQVNPTRFRPNLVISGGEPYVEDNWKNLKIGSNNFTSLGGCNRCQMINFDNQEGQVQTSNEPLLTLASYRRIKGKILFGILLRYNNGIQLEKDTDSWLHVGDEVQ